MRPFAIALILALGATPAAAGDAGFSARIGIHSGGFGAVLGIGPTPMPHSKPYLHPYLHPYVHPHIHPHIHPHAKPPFPVTKPPWAVPEQPRSRLHGRHRPRERPILLFPHIHQHYGPERVIVVPAPAPRPPDPPDPPDPPAAAAEPPP
ncbi:MAG TPA: hypothetical protein VMM59_10710, partial [Thermohalobaculum sp.]|nr:hypothetical protein [Thermohalobaculum sp.]